MILEVRRHLEWSDDNATEGELLIDGNFAGFTLEPPRLDPPEKPRAIPCGTYDLTWAFSPKHNRDVPLVENVPGFEGVEIHIGNWPTDTAGCLLVGEDRGKDMIGNSTPAIDSVYEKVKAAFNADQPMAITYTEVSLSSGNSG
jgi:hypothetical protein